NINGVFGPDVLDEFMSSTDFRQVQTASRTVAPVAAGSGVQTAVTLANISPDYQFGPKEWSVITARLMTNGQPVGTRSVKVPLGEFARVRLSGVAPAAAAYGISLSQVRLFGVSKTSMRFVTAPGAQPSPQVLSVANTTSMTYPDPWVWSAVADAAWL